MRTRPARSNYAFCKSLDGINIFACVKTWDGRGNPDAVGGSRFPTRVNDVVFVVASV